MQIQSMTGYGKGTAGGFCAEVRSTNHKNLDVFVNVPNYLLSYEPVIKKKVKKIFSRGRIDVYIPRQEQTDLKIRINKQLAAEYFSALNGLRDELSISQPVGIEILASQRDIFVLEEPEIDQENLNNAIESALEDLRNSRLLEGKELAADISERLNRLKKHADLVEKRKKVFTEEAKNRLNDRLKEFLGAVEIDETRIIQETAVMLERTDITEEIVRLKSHLNSFEDIMVSGDAVGKKLDFFAQEILREINTIGSKAQDIEITGNVVEMKNELEKIREQVQNIQ